MPKNLRWSLTPFACLVLSTALLAIVVAGCTPLPDSGDSYSASQDGYLFCFWNVENLFDDRHDGRSGPGDKEFDVWLGKNPEILKLKLARLSEALLKLNAGKGPDILAIVEVEGVRAAELLQQELNSKIIEPSLHYTSVLMKEVRVGRHIAPAILTRLPVVKDRTRGQGSRFRIVEGHLVVDGQELVVLASHWTSRLRQGSEKGRAEYADKLYGTASAMHRSNPGVDVLICGDFNDSPDDVSVTQHLRATGDLQAVLQSGGQLKLLNLMADKDAASGYGTHYYSKWLIFDHIVVSPGLLDQKGWTCDPASLRTVSDLTKPGDRLGRPWRFGGERDAGPRGYSDHFPVTVRLKVQR
jgi:endonuclease/exonuclease/phosphatase family metal-dependent hydrolase